MFKGLNPPYDVIYADPPWKTNFHNRRGLSEEAKSKLYKTMKSEEIIAMPVKALANHSSCALFLWVLNSELQLGLDVMSSWGFQYKTVAFTWVKLTITGKYHFGGGNWTRSNPELCLLGTLGKVNRQNKGIPNLMVSEIEAHSQKPAEIRDRITGLTGCKRPVELFARQKVLGWDSWGDQL